MVLHILYYVFHWVEYHVWRARHGQERWYGNKRWSVSIAGKLDQARLMVAPTSTSPGEIEVIRVLVPPHASNGLVTRKRVVQKHLDPNGPVTKRVRVDWVGLKWRTSINHRDKVKEEGASQLTLTLNIIHNISKMFANTSSWYTININSFSFQSTNSNYKEFADSLMTPQ